MKVNASPIQRKQLIFSFLPRSQGYKSFFMHNSVEHKSLNALKYKNIKKFSFF